MFTNLFKHAVFVFQKLGKKNQSCCKGVFLSQLTTKPNKFSVLDAGSAFKDYGDLYTVQKLRTDFENMDANTLNHWLRFLCLNTSSFTNCDVNNFVNGKK